MSNWKFLSKQKIDKIYKENSEKIYLYKMITKNQVTRANFIPPPPNRLKYYLINKLNAEKWDCQNNYLQNHRENNDCQL